MVNQQPPLAKTQFCMLFSTRFPAFVQRLHSGVSAILDHNSLRILGNSAGSIPGHAGTSQAVKGHAGVTGLQLLADLAGIHIAGDAGFQNCLVHAVDNVVCVSSELVRGFAVSGNVSGNKCLGLFILSVSSERSQQHQALSQGGIKALNIQDAIHAIAAEEDGLIAGLVGSGQDLRSLGVVDGQEHQLSASFLALGNLGGQVALVVAGESFSSDDLKSLGLSFGLELGVNAGRVSVRRVIDDADLGSQSVLGNVVSGCNTLVGVGEADLVDIVAGFDNGLCRGCLLYTSPSPRD